MFTVKEYYTRKVLGTYASKKLACAAIQALGLMYHHSKGNVIIAIG